MEICFTKIRVKTKKQFKEEITMLKKTGGVLLLVAALSTSTFAGFEFHGYARAGAMLNGKNALAGKGATDQGTFDLNGPAIPFLHNVGRLGNENNNYLEAELTNTFKAGSTNAAIKMRLASKDYEYGSYPVGGDTENNLFIRELYTEMNGSSFAPKSTLWAGKRFAGKELLPYIIAQVLGAIFAGLVLYLIASGKEGFGIVQYKSFA